MSDRGGAWSGAYRAQKFQSVHSMKSCCASVGASTSGLHLRADNNERGACRGPCHASLSRIFTAKQQLGRSPMIKGGARRSGTVLDVPRRHCRVLEAASNDQGLNQCKCLSSCVPQPRLRIAVDDPSTFIRSVCPTRSHDPFVVASCYHVNHCTGVERVQDGPHPHTWVHSRTGGAALLCVFVPRLVAYALRDRFSSSNG